MSWWKCPHIQHPSHSYSLLILLFPFPSFPHAVVLPPPLLLGSSNGKAGTHTCHIGSQRSQLFLVSVHLQEGHGLPVLLSMASYTQIQPHIILHIPCTPCHTCSLTRGLPTSYVHICIGLCTLSHTVMLHLNLTMDHQQTVQYASPGGPLQTCFIIWPALSIVSASFDKFTSNWYNASVFLLEEDNCLDTEGPGP